MFNSEPACSYVNELVHSGVGRNGCAIQVSVTRKTSHVDSADARSLQYVAPAAVIDFDESIVGNPLAHVYIVTRDRSM